MLTSKLVSSSGGTVWGSALGRADAIPRRDARLYLALAERHRLRGDDVRLVNALVRAAWRVHQRADAPR